MSVFVLRRVSISEDFKEQSIHVICEDTKMEDAYGAWFAANSVPALEDAIINNSVNRGRSWTTSSMNVFSCIPLTLTDEPTH